MHPSIMQDDPTILSPSQRAPGTAAPLAAPLAAPPPAAAPPAVPRPADPRVLSSGAAPRPGLHLAHVLCWDDFLPARDRDALFDHVVRRGRASACAVTTYGGEGAGSREVRPDARRALGIPDDDVMRALVEARVAAARDHALAAFGLHMFPMGRIEMEATGSGNGDYFRKHSDDSHPAYFSRILSFVLYLHRHPRRFRGGALRVYDSVVSAEGRADAGSFVDVDPLDNRLVVFPSDRTHEIVEVSLDSEDFADRRITINGACWCEGDAGEVMERWRAANPPARP